MFYSCRQSAGKGNMRLSREKFHFRGICIRIFSSCTWFIHEGEQSNQTRRSPKWKLHVCLKVLWLDPFPDMLLLGSCTGVSDTHRSAPLPSDVGHQSFAPVLLRIFTTESAQTHQWRGGVAQLLIIDRRANTRCCGMITAAVSTCLTWIWTQWHTLSLSRKSYWSPFFFAFTGKMIPAVIAKLSKT